MSKPVKNLIAQSYQNRFSDLNGAVLINIRGIKSNQNNHLRAKLAEKKIKVTVVKTGLAQRALIGTAMESISELFEGPCAVVYGGESVVAIARELMERVKELPSLEFKGALMDGELFTADQFKELSKYPTRAEAQAKVITLVISPAKKLLSQVLSAGGNIAGILKALQEKLEKQGESAPEAAETAA